MSDLTFKRRNRDVILNRAKDYCENDKERLKKHTRDKYRNLSEEGKTKKREYRKSITILCLKKKKQRLNKRLSKKFSRG